MLKALFRIAAVGVVSYVAVKAARKYGVIDKVTELASDAATRLVAAWPFEFVEDDTEDVKDEAAEADTFNSHSVHWKDVPAS